MPNYQLGKIYRIASPSTDKVYIGATTRKYLSQRLGQHVGQCKLWKAGKHHYCSSFQIIELGDAYIELLEAVQCNSIDELTIRERHHLSQHDTAVNKYMRGRTLNEWRKQKVECECGVLITQRNQAKHKLTRTHLYKTECMILPDSETEQ